jgi:hypothetical protein
LNVVLSPSFEAEEGDELSIEDGRIVNVTSGRAFPIEPLPKARQAILDAGGLVSYTRARLVAARSVHGRLPDAPPPP